MSRKKKRSRKTPDEILLRYCGQIGEDDNVDPRDFSKQRHSKLDRKAFQLCKQVMRTLSQVLSELADPDLHNLMVVSVEPTPDVRQLQVIVQAPPDDSSVEARQRAHEKLNAVRSKLRQEIAGAINRRKTPEIRFAVI